MSVDSRPPLIVLVSGPPCTGTTTLARRLAADLGRPLTCKDTIKETLFKVLGVTDRAWSKRLGGASMEVLYTFVEAQLVAGQGCVAEGNFDVGYSTPVLRRLMREFPHVNVQQILADRTTQLLQDVQAHILRKSA